MKTAVRILVLVLLVALGVGVWTFVSQNRGDENQEAGLERLLSDLNSSLPEVRAQATEELRRRGTSVLPQLLAMLGGPSASVGSSQEPAGKRAQLGDTMGRGRAYRLATRGFVALGPIARPAVPELTELMKDTNCTMFASRCLASIGALEPLVAGLNSQEPAVRAGAASAVGYLTEDVHSAVPTLLQLLQDREEPVRAAAAASLGKLGLEAARVVPALIPLLEDENPTIRTAAAESLGSFKKAAQPAVPALKRTSQDSVSGVRRAARRALENIRASQAGSSGA